MHQKDSDVKKPVIDLPCSCKRHPPADIPERDAGHGGDDFPERPGPHGSAPGRGGRERRGANLYQKIIGAHLGSGEMKPGAEIGLIIDSTLTQDWLGVMAYLQYEAIGIPR